MKKSVKEVNGQLICQKDDHNDAVLLVIMEDSVHFSNRFLCRKCLTNYINVSKMTPLNSAFKIIKEKMTIEEKASE
jgi:hypothetical protein